MIVADFRILALGEGTSLEEPVERALKALQGKRVRYEVGPLGTTLEAERLEDVFDAVRACHAALRGTAGRVFTQVTVDERLDKEETAASLREVEHVPARSPPTLETSPGWAGGP